VGRFAWVCCFVLGDAVAPDAAVGFWACALELAATQSAAATLKITVLTRSFLMAHPPEEPRIRGACRRGTGQGRMARAASRGAQRPLESSGETLLYF
jgi:hypothetical protein